MHDAHCHIDLYRDYREQLSTIAERRIDTIAVTNAPSVFAACQRLASNSPYAHVAIGLHPELAIDRGKELRILLALLTEVQIVGEVGLDFVTRDITIRNEQTRIFEAVLQGCASSGGKVLSVHSRGAAREVIDLISAYKPNTTILHWYSGPVKLIDRALAIGCYFSVNPAMTKSERGREIIRAIPRDRVLIETDGPFMQIEGRPAEPSDGWNVIEYLAQLWSASTTEVEHATDQTFERVVHGEPLEVS
jgi:TatD DNase family protein